MDEKLLAARAAAGDLDSFGELYDRYFPAVYDFTWRVLRDAGAAAEVTGYAFQRAMEQLPSLVKSGTFRAGLLSIAYHDAQSRAVRAPRDQEAGAHEEAFGAFEVPDASRLDRPDVVGGDYELAALVWEALTALNARDYGLLDLHLRENMGSADLAQVLGTGKRDATALIKRMEGLAGDVIRGYIVYRRGSAACPALQQTLASLDTGRYDDEVRRAVDEHIHGCAVCTRARDAIGVEPLAVFAEFAPIVAPMALKGEIWRELAGKWTRPPAVRPATGGFGARSASPYARGGSLMGAAAGAGLGSHGDGGFPLSGQAVSTPEWDRNRVMLFTGGAVVLLALAFAGAAAVYGALGGGDNGTTSGPPVATRTSLPTRSATPAGTPAGVGVTTPTANATLSATAVPSETPTPEPPPPTAAPPVVSPVPISTPTPRPAPTTKPVAPTATPRTAKATPTKCPPGGCR